MISIIAIANVVAAIAVLGWLVSTHRLSPERIHALRTLFADPVYVEEARLKAEEREREAAAAEAVEQGMVGTMPINAEQRLAILREGEEMFKQQNERIQRETRDLIETLRNERAALDRMIADFEKDRDAFDAMRAMISEQETSAQFQQTLKVLEGMKPSDGAEVLDAMIVGGKKNQVVNYLNAMSPRTASRILTEFEARDPALAADLLERLRTFGIEAVPE